MDDVIRDLAGYHGHGDLPDQTVTEVKRKLSEAYIDDILDGSSVFSDTGTAAPTDSGTPIDNAL